MTLAEDTRKLREQVKELIESYDVGDRPMSPPAWLLQLERSLSDALYSMNEKIMGDRSYG